MKKKSERNHTWYTYSIPNRDQLRKTSDKILHKVWATSWVAHAGIENRWKNKMSDLAILLNP